VENCGRVRQATDENRKGRMRIALWITQATDTQLRICNSIVFFTSTIVTRTLLSVTFSYIPCVVCLDFNQVTMNQSLRHKTYAVTSS
jgi:uncharacterized membrane protein YagU involved in acid resistance